MKKWIYRIALLIALIVFGFSAFQLYKIYNESKAIDQENEQLTEIANEGGNQELSIDWSALKASAPNVVGWIYVPGSDGISFPIVQGEDNEFYLNHTTLGESNIRGAIFLDSQASPDFSDENNIVYGHSVEGGGMFSSLDRFEDQSFFDSHPIFYLLTPDHTYRCDILAFAKTIEGSSFYTTYQNNDTAAHQQAMLSEALYYRDVDVTNKNFVTLSTCDLDFGFDSINRLVLVGVPTETNEPVILEE